MRKLAWSALVLLVACSSASGPAAPPPVDPQVAELRQSMTELLERLDVLNDRIARLEEEQAAAVQKPAPDVATGSSPSHDGLKPVTTSPLVNAQIATAYRDAIVLFGRNRLAESRAAFQKVLDADPHGELADNALFWIGETYYAAGQFGEAIGYYSRVARDYSDQNKAPDAMYKLALAYEKTSDLTLAKQTLEQLIARYPYSGPAAAAKAELKRIKY